MSHFDEVLFWGISPIYIGHTHVVKLFFVFLLLIFLLQEIRLNQEPRNVERNLVLLPNAYKISPKQDLAQWKKWPEESNFIGSSLWTLASGRSESEDLGRGINLTGD